VAIPNIYKTTEENLMAGILLGLGGSIAAVGSDQFSTKNDLLLAILNQIESGSGGGGTLILTSQYGTQFTVAVNEELDEILNTPNGQGSITITKIP
jgi:hypothetical protein